MQQAVPVGQGAMAAILGLEADLLQSICLEAAQATGEVVEAANFNDPKQTVISGSCAGVSAAGERLKAAGAKRVLPLAVSAPFHCSLMKPAADRLRERLLNTALRAPAMPVMNNIDVRTESDAARIRDALYRQAFGPVRWFEGIRAIRALGIAHFVECGPGKVLAGMVKRIDAEAAASSVFDPASLADTRGLLT